MDGPKAVVNNRIKLIIKKNSFLLCHPFTTLFAQITSSLAKTLCIMSLAALPVQYSDKEGKGSRAASDDTFTTPQDNPLNT